MNQTQQTSQNVSNPVFSDAEIKAYRKTLENQLRYGTGGDYKAPTGSQREEILRNLKRFNENPTQYLTIKKQDEEYAKKRGELHDIELKKTEHIRILEQLNALPIPNNIVRKGGYNLNTMYPGQMEKNNEIRARRKALENQLWDLGYKVVGNQPGRYELNKLDQQDINLREQAKQNEAARKAQEELNQAQGTGKPPLPPNPNQSFLPNDESQPGSPVQPGGRPRPGTPVKPGGYPVNPGPGYPVRPSPIRPGDVPDYSSVPYRDRPLEAIPPNMRHFYQQPGGVRESVIRPGRPIVDPQPRGSIMPDGRYMLDDGKTQRVFARDPKTGAIDFASGGEIQLVYAQPSALRATQLPAGAGASPTKPSSKPRPAPQTQSQPSTPQERAKMPITQEQANALMLAAARGNPDAMEEEWQREQIKNMPRPDSKTAQELLKIGEQVRTGKQPDYQGAFRLTKINPMYYEAAKQQFEERQAEYKRRGAQSPDQLTPYAKQLIAEQEAQQSAGGQPAQPVRGKVRGTASKPPRGGQTLPSPLDKLSALNAKKGSAPSITISHNRPGAVGSTTLTPDSFNTQMSYGGDGNMQVSAGPTTFSFKGKPAAQTPPPTAGGGAKPTFRNIKGRVVALGGQVRVVGTTGPKSPNEADLPQSMGQTQPTRPSAPTKAKTRAGMR
jgi:hypothetical protein